MGTANEADPNLGHAGKGAHAGYGKLWFETLKAAVDVTGLVCSSSGKSVISICLGRVAFEYCAPFIHRR
jgi:hypothetical protein